MLVFSKHEENSFWMHCVQMKSGSNSCHESDGRDTWEGVLFSVLPCQQQFPDLWPCNLKGGLINCSLLTREGSVNVEGWDRNSEFWQYHHPVLAGWPSACHWCSSGDMWVPNCPQQCLLASACKQLCTFAGLRNSSSSSSVFFIMAFFWVKAGFSNSSQLGGVGTKAR